MDLLKNVAVIFSRKVCKYDDICSISIFTTDWFNIETYFGSSYVTLYNQRLQLGAN